jgi:hypothetical protein
MSAPRPSDFSLLDHTEGGLPPTSTDILREIRAHRRETFAWHEEQEVLNKQFAGVLVSPEEREWIRLACKAEARKEVFRAAVIEKSVVALVILFLTAMVAGVGVVLTSYIQQHGWKQ